MVRRSPDRLREPTDDLDDEAPDYLGTVIQSLVPRTLSHRAMSISVSTERDSYELGEPVEISVTLFNRLPVPVEVVTTTQQLWGWSVDGHPSAREEPLHISEKPRAFTFDARERRRFTRTWEGRIRREGTPRRWRSVDPGTYRIEAFIELTNRRVTDETTVELRARS